MEITHGESDKIDIRYLTNNTDCCNYTDNINTPSYYYYDHHGFDNHHIEKHQFKNGDVYIGPISKSRKLGGGNGIMLYRDGSAFVGMVESGIRCGMGTFIHDATDVQYDGNWMNDYWDGPGTLFSVHDRTVLYGIWKRGELVGEGKRFDLNTGMVWAERYENGCLASQKLLNLDFCGSESSSDVSEEEKDEDVIKCRNKKLKDNDIKSIHNSDLYNRTARHISGTPCRRRAVATFVGSESFLRYCKTRIDKHVPQMLQKESVDLQNEKKSKQSDDVLRWNNETVLNWLRTVIPNENVIGAFEEHNITGAQLLLTITRESLKKDIGIIPFGLRIAILKEIKKLRASVISGPYYRCTGEPETPLCWSGGVGENHHYAAAVAGNPDNELRRMFLSGGTSSIINGRNMKNNFSRDSILSDHFVLRNIPVELSCSSNSILNNFYIPFEQLEFVELIGGDKSYFSSTYKGRWFSKTVAIKVLTGRLIDETAWIEYLRKVVQFKHPNLALVLGVSVREPDLHCIVSEFAVHGSLLDCLHGNDCHRVFDEWKTKANRSKVGKPVVLINKPWFLSTLSHRKEFIQTHSQRQREIPHITSVEAGSVMPLNHATEPSFRYEDGQATLTIGRLNYPNTTSSCPHIDDFLDVLTQKPNPLLGVEGESIFEDRKRRNKQQGSKEILAELLSNQKLLLSIAKGIVLACIHLSHHEMDHGNLKSSNVLLDEFFHVKVTDFGQRVLMNAFENLPLLKSPVYRISPSRERIRNSVLLNDQDDDIQTPPDSSHERAEPKVVISCPSCFETFDAASLDDNVGPVIEATLKRQRRLNWCAPEVLRIPTRYYGIDSASDVYSLGMILLHILTLQMPFRGLSPTHIRIVSGYGGVKPSMDTVWVALKGVVGQCLEFNSKQRPKLDHIWSSLINVHDYACSTAEDALFAFMHGHDIRSSTMKNNNNNN